MTTSPQLIADVEVFIEGSGPDSIVMVHGWPDTYRLWDEQVAHLQADYRCIRFTLPGFDISKPRQAYSMDEMVATLRRVIELTCPGEKVTLMLHDWGCAFGYQLAMRHPGLVRRIIGVDVGDAGSPAHRQSLSLKHQFAIFAYQAFLALAWALGGGVSGGVGGRIGDGMARAMVRWMRCPADPQYVGANQCFPYFIQWTGAYGSYRHNLPFKPTCPMLYLYGRRKPFQFQSAPWLAALRAAPGSDALEFSTGHWVMKSKPAEFNAAVSAWLAGPASAVAPTAPTSATQT